jgi:hypothetical protein
MLPARAASVMLFSVDSRAQSRRTGMKLFTLPRHATRLATAMLFAAGLATSLACSAFTDLGLDDCARREFRVTDMAAHAQERSAIDCADAIAGHVAAAYDAATTPDEPPAAPTGLRGERDSARIVLRWADTNGETHYVLTAANARSGRSFTLPAPAPTLGANTTMYIDDVLGPTQPGGAEYRLQACNTGGCSVPATVVVR